MNETQLVGAAEMIREACLQAAIEGYEDALMSGLCREGAWEAAVSAIRRADLGGVASATATTTRSPRDLPLRLERQLSSAGPPATESGVAATGAIAAGLVEWTAGHLEEDRPTDVRQRAHRIRARAAVLQSALAAAAQPDADLVESPLDAREKETSPDTLIRKAESALEIAARCAQVATLAVELTPHAPRALRLDLEVALRLGWNASRCALALYEAHMRSEEDGTERMRNINRRAWRVRLLLRRAAPLLRSEESE